MTDNTMVLAAPSHIFDAIRTSQRVRAGLAGLAAFGLPFLVYLLTLAPTIYNLDSAELTTAVATGGIIRATGYPLYLVLGKLFAWLPAGDMGFRLNLFSAVCGALTIFLADRILRRLQVGSWARLGALGLLATAPYFWAMSLIAEVYTLHTALMAGVILLLLRWAEAPGPARLVAAVFLLALSFGNHAATILIVPGFIFFIASHPWRRWLALRPVAVSAIATGLGLAVFAILPWRYGQNPAFNYAGSYDASGAFNPVNLQTVDGLVWLITGKAFAGQMFGYRPAELVPEVGGYLSQLATAFLAVGLAPALFGAARLLRRDWRVGGLLILLFLANAVFYINYRVVDKATMYLPTYLVWAVWLGLGYQWLVDYAGRNWPNGRPARLLQLILIAVVLLALGRNWRVVDRSGDWSTREQSETILARVEEDALIFGWWETVPGIQYLQLVEGQRPDVTAINRFLISGRDMNQLILSQLGRRPIYINNPSVELLREARAVPAGSLYRLYPRGD
jgi:hypothetical protein